MTDRRRRDTDEAPEAVGATEPSFWPDPDPEQVLRAMLKISPEDAEKVREDTPGTRKRPESQTGPEKEERPDQWPDRSHGNGL